MSGQTSLFRYPEVNLLEALSEPVPEAPAPLWGPPRRGTLVPRDPLSHDSTLNTSALLPGGCATPPCRWLKLVVEVEYQVIYFSSLPLS